jgi:hypothetical protein
MHTYPTDATKSGIFAHHLISTSATKHEGEAMTTSPISIDTPILIAFDGSPDALAAIDQISSSSQELPRSFFTLGSH